MGLPGDNAEGYRDGSPLTHAQHLRGNLLLVHGTEDATVPIGQSRDFLAANDAAGGTTRLLEPPAAHRAFIDPRTEAWRTTAQALPGLLADAIATPASAGAG